jgi:hypothetical protein
MIDPPNYVQVDPDATPPLTERLVALFRRPARPAVTPPDAEQSQPPRKRKRITLRWYRSAGETGPLDGHPPSLADVWAYTRAKDWVPGEQAPVIEALGQAYGVVVALPATAIAYAAAWIVQRPTRAAVALIAALIVRYYH